MMEITLLAVILSNHSEGTASGTAMTSMRMNNVIVMIVHLCLSHKNGTENFPSKGGLGKINIFSEYDHAVFMTRFRFGDIWC